MEFITTVAEPKRFLRSALPCIAIAGKSNVGKSSLINSLSGRTSLAKVGKKPGKTANINYYLADRKVYLADLPGYGYAKVEQREKERWAGLMEEFFSAKDTFSAGILLVDARHASGQNDKTMCELFLRSGKPFFVVANKADKLDRKDKKEYISFLQSELQLPEEVILMAYSAKNGYGRSELISYLQKFL